MPPVYASTAEVEALIEGLVVDNLVAFERLVMRAERDVDSLLGPLGRYSDTGLKVNPADLEEWAADALKRAVAAQVEHLIAVGPANVAAPAAKRTKGPDFEVEHGDGGAAPRIGPLVPHELAPLRPYFRRGARARA